MQSDSPGEYRRTEVAQIPCRKCGEPVTWFNYQNIWEGGKIVAREHTNCEALDILAYKPAAHTIQAKKT